jgi:hypothetical protein
MPNRKKQFVDSFNAAEGNTNRIYICCNSANGITKNIQKISLKKVVEQKIYKKFH